MPSYQNDPIIVRTTTPSGQENYNGGIYGESNLFNGVRGVTTAPGHGAVVGVSENKTEQAGPGVFGLSRGVGVAGESSGFNGIRGISHAAGHGACVGVNDNDTPQAGPGVYGESKAAGVWGNSKTWHGVYGETQSTTGGTAVFGEHKNNGTGVVGKSAGGIGVWGISETYEGMHAETKSTTTAALAAYQMNPGSETAALYAKHVGKRLAGFFDGGVEITGSLTVQGTNINGLIGRLQALENREQELKNRVNTLQQQLASLQQKQAEDVEGIAVSLVTLAARVTALES